MKKKIEIFLCYSIHSSIHPSMHIYPSIHACIHPFMHPFMHAFIRSSIHPFMHPLIHLFVSYIYLTIHPSSAGPSIKVSIQLYMYNEKLTIPSLIGTHLQSSSLPNNTTITFSVCPSNLIQYFVPRFTMLLAFFLHTSTCAQWFFVHMFPSAGRFTYKSKLKPTWILLRSNGTN